MAGEIPNPIRREVRAEVGTQLEQKGHSDDHNAEDRELMTWLAMGGVDKGIPIEEAVQSVVDSFDKRY